MRPVVRQNVLIIYRHLFVFSNTGITKSIYQDITVWCHRGLLHIARDEHAAFQHLYYLLQQVRIQPNLPALSAGVQLFSSSQFSLCPCPCLCLSFTSFSHVRLSLFVSLSHVCLSCALVHLELLSEPPPQLYYIIYIEVYCTICIFYIYRIKRSYVRDSDANLCKFCVCNSYILYKYRFLNMNFPHPQ